MTTLSTKALVIATALYAVDPITRMRQPEKEMADSLYEAVGHLELTDESKADVYAQLAEKLEANTNFKDACAIIAKAIGGVRHG